MLLRELEAFEACWLDLKDQYPTSRQDNTLIAHAMGQIVDLVEKPDQVERSLPDHLKILFRRLAIAYFQGYIPRHAHPAPMKPVPVAPPASTATVVKAPQSLSKNRKFPQRWNRCECWLARLKSGFGSLKLAAIAPCPKAVALRTWIL